MTGGGMKTCDRCGTTWRNGRALGGHMSTHTRTQEHVLRPLLLKEDSLCCQSRALPGGRPVIGFCSVNCARRPRAVQ